MGAGRLDVPADPSEALPPPEGQYDVDTRSRSGLRAWGTYLAVGLLGAVGAVYFFEPWEWAQGGIFPGGGDLLWVQAMAQVHKQAGPLGTTEHLGWPNGFSPWSHPQLGLLFGAVTWAAGQLGIGSAKASLGALAAASALNAMACMFLFRSLVRDRMVWGVSALSLVCALSPFVITKLGHFNVASFYLVPLAIGIALRIGESHMSSRWVLAGAVLVAGVLSPAWWLVVTILMVGTCMGVSLLSARWRSAASFAVVVTAAALSLAFQWGLQARFKDVGALPTRGPWESNVYGGHLVDLFLGSPLLNSRIQLDDALIPGMSLEASPLGIVLSVAAALSVLLVMAVFPWGTERLDANYMLRSTTTVALLFFLLGGLGNLQAGLAVALGGESPARVWARMSLVLGLLGVGWALALVAQAWRPRTLPRVLSVGVPAVLLAVTFMDARYSPELDAAPQPLFAEFGPVRFIESASEPCPVAQLPQDDFPIPRALPDGSAATVDALYYRGFIPYLMAPDYYWSFTSWNPGIVNGLEMVTTILDDRALDVIAAQGFCAVLYDSSLGDAARSMGVELEGRDLAVTRASDYSEGRYSVYLLDPSAPS